MKRPGRTTNAQHLKALLTQGIRGLKASQETARYERENEMKRRKTLEDMENEENERRRSTRPVGGSRKHCLYCDG